MLRTQRPVLVLAWAALVSAAACGDNRAGTLDAAVDGPPRSCVEVPCRNGGVCEGAAGAETCTCTPGFAGASCEDATWMVPAVPTTQLDLLLVVDNSAAMAVEQQQLAAAAPALLAALITHVGRLPDLHVGVVTSNAGAAGAPGVPGCPPLGDDGALAVLVPFSTERCGGVTDDYVRDVAGANGDRVRNYGGDLAEALGCLVERGTTGCGFEMHLESAWRALQPGRNPGFRRADAHLALVVVADEDDCSTADGTVFGDPLATLTSPLGPRTSFRCHEFGVVCDDDPAPREFGPRQGCRPRADSPYMFPLGRYVDFVRTVETAPGRVSVAGIVGTFDGSHLAVVQDPTPGAPALQPAVERSCGLDPSDPLAGASPPVRLAAFLAAFSDRTSQASACADRYDLALSEVAAVAARGMAGVRCLGDTLADLDATSPGLQPSCTVTLVNDPPGPGRTDTLLAPCVGAAAPPGPPCWTLDPDPALCPGAAAAFRLVPGTTPPYPGAIVEARCLTR